MVYPITKRVVPLLIRPWLGKCTGIENIPKDKGAILAANHASYLDHFIVGSQVVGYLNKVAYFLAKKEHFDTFFQRQWHKYLKAIPIDRESGGKEALAKAIEHLKKGDLIMIYPEGTRTLTGKMNRAKTGVARLALAAEVPVIPIGITNAFKILPKGKIIPKLGFKADLHIGKPLYFKDSYGKYDDHEEIRMITTVIMKEIAKLSKQEYDFDNDLLKNKKLAKKK
jgi:1-acyl-sn-glycerol-3-phosphate acyltransferase